MHCAKECAMTVDQTHARTGVVFNYQRFSLNDGPGIRTVVFLKGCQLHCPWCSNPESQHVQPEPFYLAERCLHCGACAEICPQHAIRMVPDGDNVIDRSRCTGCGKCAEACACDAMRMMGKEQRVQTVLEQVLKDEACYRTSGGGVTLSGGEPLGQGSFAVEILRACKEHGVHTAVETTGFVPLETIQAAAPYVDCFLYDVKHLDAQVHRQTVGTDNARILDNLSWLMAHGANVIARLPMIPGFNTDDAYLSRLKLFLERSGVKEVHVLPYHIFGEGKYRSLDRAYQMQIAPMREDEAQRIRNKLASDCYQIKIHG